MWENSNRSGVQNLGERVNLMRNGVINYSSFLVGGVIGIGLVPFLLRGLGAEQYGLWIAVLALAEIPSVLDFGMCYAVRREVASLDSETLEPTRRLVVTAGICYLGLGLLGAALIAVLGLLLGGALHLSTENRRIAPAVFALAGFGFFGDQVLIFATSVLVGLQRFGTANLISIVGAVMRAIGIIALLLAGAGFLPVVAWQEVVGVVIAVIALAIVGRLKPDFRLRLRHFDWNALRLHLPFGLTSLLSDLASQLLWNSAVVLVSFVKGSAALVPYYVGQKFPTALSYFSRRLAEVLFPAASKHERTRETTRTREILEVGTRWNIALLLPICITLFIITPNLLHAWLGEAQPIVVLVMRLSLAAILADAAGVPAMHVLWGCGEASGVFKVLGGAALVSLGLGLWLLLRIGIAGPAVALLCVLSGAGFWFLRIAARRCGIPLPRLIRETSRGLLIPAGACAAMVFALAYFFQPARWPGIIGIAMAAGTAYALPLYFGGAREEERMFIKNILGLPGSKAHGHD